MKNENLEKASDEQLFKEIKKGNRKAWELIIKSYYNALFVFILGMVKEKESAEELVQDVFVNIWDKRDKINITTSLKAYLYRAARNHTLNFLKRKKFEMDYHKRLAQTSSNLDNKTEESIHYTELQKHLFKAIEDLPDSCKHIFKMSRYEELTYKEISDVLGVPVRSVHYQIGLALKELRNKLKGLYSKESIPFFALFLVLAQFFPF
ncbi:RNA polymerase sigma-70 factor [Flammeovirgaceae bacterium SG7u.111]|nr:RNA polymerase sigma-70 factor [Flammeovirgaceae bacterium SG7u.132]WPO33522.1 RNA polymerase sigma-70 factor [Flammeovirgaceae bacterium SG7u.111]